MRSLATRVRHLVRLVFVVCGLPFGLSACGASPVVPAAAASAVQAPTAYSVLFVNHGRHTGLLLRASDAPAGAWPGLQAVAWPTPAMTLTTERLTARLRPFATPRP